MFEQEQQAIEEQIRAYCKQQDIPSTEELKWARIPFSGEWGIATSFFQTAANEARSGKKVVVPQRAQEIAEGVAEHLGTPQGFSRVEAVKGYLNLYFSTDEYARTVLDTVITQGVEYGNGLANGQSVMVEFSQPNTHKALHVGHLRNMMLGAAVANILECAGYEVVRSNYIGDFGRDVMKWIWNYEKRHDGEEPPEDTTRWMGDLYAEATQKLEEDEAGETEIQALFADWESKDSPTYKLWQKTRQWSLDGFNDVYTQMGIHFDRFYYESEMEESAKEIVEELISKGIVTDDRPDGPAVIKVDELLGLDKETYRVLAVLRSDGTSLYGAWDLALAQKKFIDYPLDRSVYVVDVRQSLHFQQVFKTLEAVGFEKIKDAFHLPYEVVNLPGNLTMSSRDGVIVLLEDFIREATQRAYDVSLETNPELDEVTRKGVANAVALGSIKYPLLARDNTKIATFDWETALDFNGHSAPYIQYAHVRANSILRRVDKALPDSSNPTYELEPAEIALIELISQIPDTVQRAADEYRTLHITNLAYDLAKAFNDFYNRCPVLKAEPEVQLTRLRLVAAARQSIANCLRILGIEAPEVM
ncbi:MAG: arginine--tRNA ligase [Chloroflexi bacterium]|nr:MAG: arginine--tRNA ligase [Chloroflexota bacterium]MBL1197276.1 arginine--tRNA ligase [Chloroflexota bacterium]NOH14571.1 arginine--tRNA ligase [Chloroflexota bacterium]